MHIVENVEGNLDIVFGREGLILNDMSFFSD